MIKDSTAQLTDKELIVVKDEFRGWILMINRNSPNKEYVHLMKKQILENQVLLNRINMIIKDKENEIEYIEKQYPDIESESHNLHHEWKAKLDDLDMFKRLLL